MKNARQIIVMAIVLSFTALFLAGCGNSDDKQGKEQPKAATEEKAAAAIDGAKTDAAKAVDEAKSKAAEALQNAKKEAGDAVQALKEQTGDAARTIKDTYVAALSAKLEAVSLQIDAMQARLDAMGDKAAGESKNQLASLKEKRDAAAKKLAELKDSSGDAWQTLKAGVDAASEELQKAYEDAKAKIQ